MRSVLKLRNFIHTNKVRNEVKKGFKKENINPVASHQIFTFGHPDIFKVNLELITYEQPKNDLFRKNKKQV